MSLETATYIDELDDSNPLDADPKSQGAAHLRLIKAVLQATFPNISGAANPSESELNLLASLTALSVLGVTGNADAAPAAIAAGTDGQVLRRSGTAVAFGSIDDTNSAAIGHNISPKYVSSDVTFTATTTLANITGLTSITLEPDTVYMIEGYISYLPSSSGGLKLGFSASQTVQDGRWMHTDSSSIQPTTDHAVNGGTYAGSVPAAGVQDAILIKGFVHTHATLTSTLTLQGAQNSAAGNTKIKKGSWLRLQKLGTA